jgi:hypothetical protein
MFCSAAQVAAPAAPPLHPKYRRSDELGDEITELCAYIFAATYQLLEKIRQFDEEGLWQLGGVCSCAHWLNWKCGIGMNAAREKVRVAHALGELPKISESFSKGEISYSKVRAMTRVATIDNEDYLLQIARHGTAFHMETLVQKYRRAKRLQESDDANKQHSERALHVYYEPDGSMVFQIRLPAEKGAMVLKAVDLATDQAEQEVSSDSENSAETPPRKETFERRRVDALADIAESYLANGPESSSSADRYQVMLHVSAETLTNAEGDLSHIEDGPRVSAETSRRLGCDASISVLSENEEGETLNIGRKTRVIPAAMRRALKARDEGCRFPGCTHKHYIDGHHIEHWSTGGETSLANLVQLCRHHHGLVHEGGFACTISATGDLEFRDPHGQLIPATGTLPPISPDLDITQQMRDRYEDLSIDANTCVSRYEWGGIDWDLAVGALFH